MIDSWNLIWIDVWWRDPGGAACVWDWEPSVLVFHPPGPSWIRAWQESQARVRLVRSVMPFLR